jgi:hypothetical protein
VDPEERRRQLEGMAKDLPAMLTSEEIARAIYPHLAAEGYIPIQIAAVDATAGKERASFFSFVKPDDVPQLLADLKALAMKYLPADLQARLSVDIMEGATSQVAMETNVLNIVKRRVSGGRPKGTSRRQEEYANIVQMWRDSPETETEESFCRRWGISRHKLAQALKSCTQ